MQELQGPHLVGDPRIELVQLSPLCLLAKGSERPRIGAAPTFPALLVDGIPLEASAFARSVDLGRHEIVIERGIGAAAVDDGLLAALDRPDDLVDEVVLKQGIEMRQEDLFDSQVLLGYLL